MTIKVSDANAPIFKEVTVKSKIPAKLTKLQEISRNLWWVWNDEAIELFRFIDLNLWNECNGNPVLFLERIDSKSLDNLEKDAEFMGRLEEVYKNFKNYINEKPNTKKPSIAYFSMEYGLTETLKIYSGGLGVLAGDYLKEASDCNIDMVAVGFLYKYGYFTQSLSVEGYQIANYEAQNFNLLPLSRVLNENGEPLVMEIPYPGRNVYAYVWKVSVGRVPLYLLDTTHEANSESDQSITHKLYGGDWENRMKQEYLLGVGGILTLNRLGIKKQVYHCNEGHAALINAQRLVDYIQNDGLSFNQALEVVRASSLYTVHTPVPAGHDKFEEGLIRYYMGSFPERMGISWGDFMAMGRENPENQGEKFSMSVFACNCSQEANGVSWLHGKVSQKMFSPIWKGYLPEELHVSYVTNGVHYPTWATSEWKNLFIKTFGKEFLNDQSNTSYWEKIYNVSDEEIWKVREARKKKLFEYIRVKFSEDWMKTNGNPSHILKVLKQINPDALTIGFGRRFATYKRAHLLFTDLERLSKIVNNPNNPVQFFFTGKAHPADGGGQNLIKHIVEISRRPEFQGKIIFLENYDMALAKRLISGVDIWLNTPTRPLEASGTSGEKAQMNGVLNFSVLDGWWLEGYVKGAGWALTEKRTFQNQDQQDQLDAATIYNMLENEIIPLYYAKNSKGFSPEWIMFIKNSLAKITPRFTTKRMIDDYIERFYQPLANRVEKMKANSFAKAKEIAAWKEFMATNWGTIETKDVQFPDALLNQPKVEEDYTIHLTVDRKNISADAIGVELIVTETAKNGEDKIVLAEQFKQEGENGTNVNYALTFQLSKPGTYKYGIRIYAKNEDLPHRMDFNYLRWVNF